MSEVKDEFPGEFTYKGRTISVRPITTGHGNIEIQYWKDTDVNATTFVQNSDQWDTYEQGVTLGTEFAKGRIDAEG